MYTCLYTSQHPTPNVDHPIPTTQYRPPNTNHPIPTTQYIYPRYRVPNTEHLVPTHPLPNPQYRPPPHSTDSPVLTRPPPTLSRRHLSSCRVVLQPSRGALLPAIQPCVCAPLSLLLTCFLCLTHSLVIHIYLSLYTFPVTPDRCMDINI